MSHASGGSAVPSSSQSRPREPPSPASAPAAKRQRTITGVTQVPNAQDGPTQGSLSSSRFRMPSSFRGGGATPRESTPTIRQTSALDSDLSTASSRIASPAVGAASNGTVARRRAATSAGAVSASVTDTGGAVTTNPGGTSGRRAVVDIVMDQKTSIQKLETTIAGLDTAMKRLQTENSTLLTRVGRAEIELAESREDVEDLTQRADTQEKRMLMIESFIEREGDLNPFGQNAQQVAGGLPIAAAADEAQLGAPKEQELGATASAAELKNSAQACVRAVFIGLMGVTKKARPPPVIKQGFWTVQDPNDPTRLLRPRWDDGWDDNRVGWVIEAVQTVKQDARRWSSALPQQMLDVLPEDVIESGLESSFNTWAKRYRTLRDKDAEARLKLRIANRCRARKHTKAADRQSVRHKVPRLAGAEFDWMFEWPYQSTDESDSAPVDPGIAPDTDNERAPPVLSRMSIKMRPWITYSPAYRESVVNVAFDEVDAHVFASQQEAEKVNTNGTAHHLRTRRDTRAAEESVLPIVRKRRGAKPGDTVPAKIPLALVNKEWLRKPHGRQFASTRYIADWVAGEDNMEAGNEGGDEDEEEEQDGE
ncbi:hypothetical protein C2E23DRAFT_726787 [Lenzites betulinus]|nr:hypothetical protein C2E23DRAFT_726787 [Lenzites betulinus]